MCLVGYWDTMRLGFGCTNASRVLDLMELCDGFHVEDNGDCMRM